MEYCCLSLYTGIILVTLLGMLFTKRARRRDQRLPPLIPGCIPLLGNVVGFDRTRPHITLSQWAKKYGDIFRIRLLSEDIIVLNSRDAIREALLTKGNAFAGRPFIFRIHYGFHYADDIIFGSFGAKWLEMKKCASQMLRMYTSGMTNIDEIVEEEMVNVVEIFRDTGGKCFDPSLILMTAIVNAITASVLGKRFSHSDPVMLQYKSTTRLFSEACSAVHGMELDLLPWLRFLPNQSFRKLNKARDQLDQFIDKELDEIQRKCDVCRPQCMLEALMSRVQQDSQASEPLGLTLQDVRCIFVDILVSGTLTSSIALSAFTLIMALHQDIQEALIREVDTQVGFSRLPSSNDRKGMPQMEAAILEILRYISHVPLNLPHYTMCDTNIGGYSVPKNTMVLLNLWAMHHDPRIWQDPWNFRPGRFLDEEGKLLSPEHPLRKSLMPFGAGRRMCLGETLARERLFLLASCLLHNFKILPPEDDNESSLTCDPRHFELGLILEPKPFQIRAIPRHQSQFVNK